MSDQLKINKLSGRIAVVTMGTGLVMLVFVGLYAVWASMTGRPLDEPPAWMTTIALTYNISACIAAVLIVILNWRIMCDIAGELWSGDDDD